MKKIVAVIAVTVLLLLSMSLLVSANQNQSLTLSDVEIYDKNTSIWVNASSFSTWTGSTGRLEVTNAGTYRFYGLRTTFLPAGYIRAQLGYYLKIDASFTDEYTSSSANPANPTYSLELWDDEGTVYTLQPYSVVNDADASTWTCKFALKVGDGTEIRFTKFTFETDWCSANAGQSSYTLDIAVNLTTEMTAEMALQQQYIEEITRGWETDADTSGQVNDMTGGMADAESEALGGKSDEEVKQEVAGAMTTVTPPASASTAAIGVRDLFDKMLAVFGDGYNSVLMLSLTLGSAAFLIGRSYKTKGG